VRIADDPGDTGENGKVFRGALGVASGNDHAGAWISGVDFADGVAGLSVSGGSDRAGVHDDEIGGGGFGDRGAAAREQLTLDGGAVGLSGTAAELLNKESRH